jgi:DNA repair protein RadC
MHNHPSRGPNPSGADIAVARDIVKTGAAVGITRHDL